jgi:hypothetical protein
MPLKNYQLVLTEKNLKFKGKSQVIQSQKCLKNFQIYLLEVFLVVGTALVMLDNHFPIATKRLIDQ